MKKVLLFTASAFVLFLTACSQDDKQTEEKSNEKTATTVEKEEETKEENKILEDDTAVLTDIDVKILETEFLPAGTYEHQDGDQLVVTYEVTNKSDKEITPLIGYLAAFEAYQEDENSERKLEVGMTPMIEKYDFATETQFDNIKNGGTVKNIVAYDLRDTETPVILRATKGIDGDLLGEIVVNLK